MPMALAKLKPIVFAEALLIALDLHGGRDFQMGLTKVCGMLNVVTVFTLFEMLSGR